MLAGEVAVHDPVLVQVVHRAGDGAQESSGVRIRSGTLLSAAAGLRPRMNSIAM